jgi:hypothetical protein
MTPGLDRLIGRVVDGNTDFRPTPKPVFSETVDQAGFEIVDEQVVAAPSRRATAAASGRWPQSSRPLEAVPAAKPAEPRPPVAERNAADVGRPKTLTELVPAAPRNSEDDHSRRDEPSRVASTPLPDPGEPPAQLLEQTRYVTLAPRPSRQPERRPGPVSAPAASRPEATAPTSPQRELRTAPPALRPQSKVEATTPPTVTIEIGRIEVRPLAPASQKSPRPPRRTPALTLEAYLDQRQRGLR